MAQPTILLKDSVEKLDYALARLQEIQNTLRGHSPLPNIEDLDNQIPKFSQLRFDALGGSGVNQSAGESRRWSTPAPLMHDALSEAVATSKFAKKTVDMVKVQKKQAAKSTNTSHTSQAKESFLCPCTNRINLPQPVMSAPDDNNSKPKSISKENRKTHHQTKLDLKDANKPRIKGESRSVEKHGVSKDDNASSSLQLDGPDRRVSFARVVPEEHVVSSSIIQLRTLLNREEAANEPHSQSSQHNASDCNTHLHDAQSMPQHDPIDRNMQDQPAAPLVRRSSLSMKALMQMEDKESALSRPILAQDKDKEVDSLSSSLASKSFCVQLEEIKSSKKKSWSFSQGKASDNVVVMFPNPTYDETTPPRSTPPDGRPATDHTVPKASVHEEVSTVPSTTVMSKAPPDNKARIQKREKIVRLSPCSTTRNNAQKSKSQPTPTSDIESANKSTSLKKQKWKCTLTHPPAPTLIRRLPEAHEMEEILHHGAAGQISPPRCSVGRSQNRMARDEEEGQILGNDSKTRKRSWSFSGPFVVENAASSSEARRSSLGPPGGGHSFSFLSKHFHAWKVASKKQDK